MFLNEVYEDHRIESQLGLSRYRRLFPRSSLLIDMVCRIHPSPHFLPKTLQIQVCLGRLIFGGFGLDVDRFLGHGAMSISCSVLKPSIHSRRDTLDTQSCHILFPLSVYVVSYHNALDNASRRKAAEKAGGRILPPRREYASVRISHAKGRVDLRISSPSRTLISQPCVLWLRPKAALGLTTFHLR